jgi:putative ABC transport system substrate-binding protein
MIKRREFIAGLGSVAAWPMAARAQRALPVVGVLTGGPAEPGEPVYRISALRKGLSEIGFVDGNNVEILYVGAEWQYDRLPALAAELMRRRVAVICALWNASAQVAKSATETLPVVFVVGGDPVQLGLVTRLDRPDANVTGAYNLSAALVQKRLQLLHEIVPAAKTVGFLINPTSRQKDFDLREVETAARILGVTKVILSATRPSEIETALAPIKGQSIDALLVGNDAMFYDPAAGRILKGEKLANLPVQQATRVETVLNLTTAKALGLTIPETVLATADEVIQ